jgi:hypothetical protein
MYNGIIEIYHIQISRPTAVGNGTYSTVVKTRKEKRKKIDIKTFQKSN